MQQFTIRSVFFHMSVIAISIAACRYEWSIPIGLAGIAVEFALLTVLLSLFANERGTPQIVVVAIFALIYLFVLWLLMPSVR
jgi:hypothetical protein